MYLGWMSNLLCTLTLSERCKKKILCKNIYEKSAVKNNKDLTVCSHWLSPLTDKNVFKKNEENKRLITVNEFIEKTKDAE